MSTSIIVRDIDPGRLGTGAKPVRSGSRWKNWSAD